MAEIVGGKRRLNCKTILQKYAALKAIDNGESQALVAKRLGIVKQTISNWISGTIFILSSKSQLSRDPLY